MNEYTSQGLSQSLHDKGFRGEHKRVWGDRTTLYSKFDYDGTPAYTFTELWKVLPWELRIGGDNGFKFMDYFPGNKGWEEPYNRIGYERLRTDNIPGLHIVCDAKHESPAEAVGLLLEWLIDNNHMKCEHGEGLTDYCLPCGRVNNA